VPTVFFGEGNYLNDGSVRQGDGDWSFGAGVAGRRLSVCSSSSSLVSLFIRRPGQVPTP
jgi:hypothetical protein